MSRTALSTFVLAVADRSRSRDAFMAALTAIPNVTPTLAASMGEAEVDVQNDQLRIDLVLIDAGLASSGAATLIRKLRDPLMFGSRQLPILLVGEATTPAIVQTAVRLGIQGHFTGAVSPDALRLAIRRALTAGTLAMPAPVAPLQPVVQPPAPPTPVPEEILHDAPVANKPFRHGLQTPRPARQPLREHEAFGFETPPISIRPRPAVMAMEAASLPVFIRRRLAVA